jgi:hypothetical protein
MTLAEFREKAARMLDDIPPEYQAGVDAVVVEEDLVTYPTLPGLLTLGECVTEEWPDGLAGADTHSRVVLHYGSFEALSEIDPGFDWQGEMWETLLHELLHHREAAANEAGLELFDWAVEQDYLRRVGRPFDAGFYRVLPRDADGVTRIESEIFLEAVVPPKADKAVFEWRGHSYDVPVPAEGNPIYISVQNLAAGRLWVVVWRRRGWWARHLSRPRPDPRHAVRRALPRPA